MAGSHDLVKDTGQGIQGLVGFAVRQDHLGHAAALAQGRPEPVHIQGSHGNVADDNHLGAADMPGE